MNIALDFDNTITLNPEFWFEFIALAVDIHGAEVVIVSIRDERYDRCELLDGLSEDVPVYYTRGVAKKWWMEHFANPSHTKIDIWIDDKPETILNNSEATPQELREWRANGNEKPLPDRQSS